MPGYILFYAFLASAAGAVLLTPVVLILAVLVLRDRARDRRDGS